MICLHSTAYRLGRALLLAAALAFAEPAWAGIGDVESAAGDDEPAGTSTEDLTTPLPGTTPGSTGVTATDVPAPAPTTTPPTTAAGQPAAASAVVAAPAVAPISVSISSIATSTTGDGPGSRCGGDTPAARRPAARPAAATAAASKSLGETETAIRLADEARALLRAEPAPLLPTVYCDVSADLADRGEYRAAVQAAGVALLIGQSAGDKRLLAYAARNLAYAYSLAGALDQAAHWARESLRHAAALKDARAAETIVAPVIKIQGDIALQLQRAEDAAKLYGQALAMVGSSPARPWFQLALARAEMARGRIERADALLNEARRDAPASIASALARAEGDAALAANDAAKAARLFRVAVAEAGANAYTRMWALHGLARAARMAKQPDAALSHFAQAIEAAEQVRERFRSEELKSGFFGTAQDIFDDAVDTAGDAARTEMALDFSERSRSRALLDLLIGRIEDQAHGPAGTLTFVDRAAPPQKLAEVRRHVPAGTAVVIYHVLSRRTLAWVLRQGELRQVSLPVGRDALAGAVREFVGAIIAEANGTERQAAALHDKLIAPLGLRKEEALMVVTHDALHRLPFAALRDGKDWLIERHAVATLPSLSALHALVSSSAAAVSGALVLGNPDLGAPEDELPAAEREAADVAALLPDSRLYLKDAATRSRLLAEGPGRRVVHIAAHSAIDPLDPLASPLYLAGRPKPAGAMTAREFYALDLRAVRLIVLSACQTGLGTVGRGNEIWGFQRTVLAAGARSLLVSLWAVEDEATGRLMTGFYQRWASVPMIEALRQSQVALIRSGSRQPLYWAAFTLVGDWR